MSNAEYAEIDIDEVVKAGPISPDRLVTNLMWGCVAIGVTVFLVALLLYPHELLWGAFYTSLLYWMGLSLGGVIVSVIFQIVRAKWSPPIRRLAEANVSFLPWAYLAFLGTYFGKEHLFVWARKPMIGREYWMEPDFVYLRFMILLGVMFYLLWRFVRLSLRSDIGYLREFAQNKSRWLSRIYDNHAKGWLGYEKESSRIQIRMSCIAPVLIMVYAVIYSLFAFEMIMGMDEIWYSNMFGGFQFVGNIYMGWASIALMAILLSHYSSDYNKVLQVQQLWDLGKLCTAFGILWAYMFLSQFLPQWYGNLPEETQWMILRTREEPWKMLSWITFGLCFVFPFILLISEDVKKTPTALATVCLLVLGGVWCEKYVIIMPQISPTLIPLGVVEVGIFLGFLGAYVLSIQNFLSKYPYVPVSHPLTRGSRDW